MSKRVLVTIDRGMTDKTGKVVWEHEIPILNAVHGTEVRLVSLDDVEDLQGTALVLAGTTQIVDPKDPRFKDQAKEKVSLVEVLKRNLSIGKPFSGNVADEYERLVAMYGTHPEYNLPFVEYVYGRPEQGRFKEAVAAVAEDEEQDYDLAHPGAKPVPLNDGPLTDEQMRAKLMDADIEFPPTAKGATLRKLYDAAFAQAA